MVQALTGIFFTFTLPLEAMLATRQHKQGKFFIADVPHSMKTTRNTPAKMALAVCG
jgi:hypothetical protein